MLTVSEAARTLGLRESTLRAWVMRRKISYLKLGRSIRIEQAEIDRLLEQARVPRRTKTPQ
jgi:excisionase family DNA binding protein